MDSIMKLHGSRCLSVAPMRQPPNPPALASNPPTTIPTLIPGDTNQNRGAIIPKMREDIKSTDNPKTSLTAPIIPRTKSRRNRTEACVMKPLIVSENAADGHAALPHLSGEFDG